MTTSELEWPCDAHSDATSEASHLTCRDGGPHVFGACGEGRNDDLREFIEGLS